MSENIVLMNLTLSTDLFKLIWALRYAQEPFLHVCILINASITLFFIGGYRTVIISILKSPLKLIKNLKLKMVKQSKTPIVNINGKGINSTSSNMNRNSSNAETSNNFSWMKRFLK